MCPFVKNTQVKHQEENDDNGENSKKNDFPFVHILKQGKCEYVDHGVQSVLVAVNSQLKNTVLKWVVLEPRI